MNNKLFLGFASLMFLFTLSACAATPDKTVDTVQTDKTSDAETRTVTGSYHLVVNKGPSGSPYQVCFEPAQMETVNYGLPFCFSNLEESMDILELDPSMLDQCADMSVIATLKIKDLTTNPPGTKADPCFQNRTCPINMAKLVEVVKKNDKSSCASNPEYTIIRHYAI